MKPFSREDLQPLIDRPEELSVSIFMPTRKAGKETLQNPIRFKNLLRDAEERIQQGDFLRPLETKEFLKPAQQLLDDLPFWQHQEDGLALFFSRDVFRFYRVPVPFDELAVVNRHFHLKPLLRLLSGDGRFYVLSLTKKQVKLFESTRFHISEVALEGVPTSLSEVVGSEVDEEHLQGHTAGPAGRGERIQFHGQGGAEPNVKPELRRFFAAVDRGLRRILPGEVPLVLAGVEYLLPIYREASSHPRLVEQEVRQGAADLKVDELRENAWALVEPLFVKEQREALERYRELAGTGRTSDRVSEIVPAARDGRVEVLFVARGVRRWGAFDAENRRVDVHDAPGNGSLDLLDLAAVQALLRGGKVYVVEPGAPPVDEGMIAALYRY